MKPLKIILSVVHIAHMALWYSATSNFLMAIGMPIIIYLGIAIVLLILFMPFYLIWGDNLTKYLKETK